MNPEFWLDKWEKNSTGFHQKEFNKYLTQYWQHLASPTQSQVVVPLCGKSLDMLWLRQQGHQVLGIEISDLAVNQFFIENSLPYTVTKTEDFVRFETDRIALWQGDFFKTRPIHFEQVAAIYDRAALVALPPLMRQSYAQHLGKNLPELAKILLVSFEYDSDRMQGPPFSVTETEVRELYRQRFYVELVKAQDVLEQYPPFQAAGLNRLTEKVFMLSPRY